MSSEINMGRRKILQNTFWLFSEKAVRLGVGFFVSAWVARYLGPQNFGTLAYCLAFVAFFETFAFWGLPSILKRELVLQQDQEKQDSLMGTCFYIFLGGGILSSLIMVGVSFFYHQISNPVHTMILPLSLIYALRAFDVIELWHESKVQMKGISMIKSGVLVLTSLLKIGLILLKAKLFYFAVVQVLEVAFCSMCYFAYDWKANGLSLFARLSFSRELAIKLLKDSWPLIVSGLTVMIFLKIDLLMLHRLKGDREVGIYSAALKLSEVWYFLPVILSSSFFPGILEARREGNQNLDQAGTYFEKVTELFSIMTYLFLAISLPLILLAKPLIMFIFKQPYFESIEIMQVHILAAIFVFWGVAQGVWDVAENMLKFSLVRSTCGAISNVVLNLILIPKYGGLGAAYATVISYGVSNFLVNLFHPKARQVFFFQMNSFFPWRKIPRGRDGGRKGKAVAMVIGHALVLPENRKRWALLAQEFPDMEVHLLIPEYWQQQWFGHLREFHCEEEHSLRYHIWPVQVTHTSQWGRYRIKGLAALLRKVRPDVIFVMQEEFTQCLHWTLLHKIVFLPQTKMFFFSWQNMAISLRHPAKRMLWSFLCKHTEGLLAGTEQIKGVFRKAGYGKKIYVQTEIGVDEKTFYPDANLRRNKRIDLQVTDDEFVIGLVGRIVKEKGVLDLAQACLNLGKDVPWKLLMVGDGQEAPTVRKIFSEAGLSEKLIMVGEVPVTETPDYFRSMDCLVLPSRTTPTWKEQFGLVLAQAMLVGVPVIGSDSGAIPEVIGDREFIFPEGNVDLLREKILKVMKGEKTNGERKNLYTIRYLAQNTYQLIQEVLS